jgi:hypothetical protein
MRSNGSKLFLALLLAVGGWTAVAQADEAAPQPALKPVKSLPWFVALSGGVGYAAISHPEVASGGAVVPVFTLHGGYTFGDRLNVGLEFSSVETSVGRDTAYESFRIGYEPKVVWQIDCYPCQPKPTGSDVTYTSLVFSTLGARVEYAPFGRDGLYLGGTAGLGFMIGLEGETGFGFGARAGYRLRPTNVLTVSIEAGMSGQLYGDTTMYMPFALATVRPYFEPGIKPSVGRPKPTPQ